MERRTGSASHRLRASTATPSWRPPVTAPPPANQLAIPAGQASGTPNTTDTATTSSRPSACCSEANASPQNLDMLVTTEYPETVTAAQIIADNLAPLGITVNIRTVDFATWLDEQNSGHFDMLMMGWLGNIDPDDFYYAQHHTGGTSNAQKFSNPEVDRLLDAGRVETNQDSARRRSTQGRDDHRRRVQLHLPLQPVGDPGVDTRTCPATRRAATRPSGSAPRASTSRCGTMTQSVAPHSGRRAFIARTAAVFDRRADRRARRGFRARTSGARAIPSASRSAPATHRRPTTRCASASGIGPPARSNSSSATSVRRSPAISASASATATPSRSRCSSACPRPSRSAFVGIVIALAHRAARRHLVGAARGPRQRRDRPRHKPIRSVDPRFLDGHSADRPVRVHPALASDVGLPAAVRRPRGLVAPHRSCPG